MPCCMFKLEVEMEQIDFNNKSKNKQHAQQQGSNTKIFKLGRIVEDCEKN